MAQILGVRFDNVSMDEALERIRAFVHEGKPRAVFTPNVDFLMLGRKDPAFRDLINAADLNLCDSVPLRWASRLLGVPLKARIAGADLLPAACELAAKEGYRVYFLGGAPGVGERAAQILTARHPDLRIVGVYAPPMGFNGDQNETWKILQNIRRAAPHILFVSLGTPKQERWIHQFGNQTGVPVAIGVGATIDFVGGTRRRAPVWMQRLGLEWLFRLCQEPRRLWRRYLLRDAPFVGLLVLEWFRLRSRRPQRHKEMLSGTQTHTRSSEGMDGPL